MQWSLEKILLKLIFKSFANIEESDRLVRIAASTGGLLNTTDSERAYELEDKLGTYVNTACLRTCVSIHAPPILMPILAVWLLRELCRVVFSAAKVAFGQEHYAGFSWRGGYQDENKGIGHMGRLRSRQLTSSEGPKLAYWPVWMPYWPKPWPVTPNTTVPYFPPVDVEYAETKLKVLHDLLYGLKGLDYKALKLIKSVKEALRVLATATAADWDGSSSSSSSSHGVVNSRAAKVLAQLSKLEKELAWVLKEQVKFVLKLKEVAFRAPLFPSATPTPSASVTATASASTSASATATASASASASAAPLLPPIPPIDDLLEEELEEEEEEEEEEIAE